MYGFTGTEELPPEELFLIIAFFAFVCILACVCCARCLVNRDERRQLRRLKNRPSNRRTNNNNARLPTIQDHTSLEEKIQPVGTPKDATPADQSIINQLLFEEEEMDQAEKDDMELARRLQAEEAAEVGAIARAEQRPTQGAARVQFVPREAV